MLYRLGAFSVRHRRAVLLFWILLVVVLGVASASLKGTTNNAFTVPGTESQRALDLLAAEFPGTGGATARIVVAAPPGQTLDQARYSKLLKPIRQAASTIPEVLHVGDPLSPTTVSKDRRIAFADLQYKVPADQLSSAAKAGLEKIAAPLRKAGLEVEFSGGVTPTSEKTGNTEVLGVVIAFIILMITFGSFIAAGLPLLTALIGVAIGLLGIHALTNVITLSSTAPVLALMLGLAVGIDYALFITSRHRQQLREGMDVETSIATAVATAGSAVAFAGLTVFIALAAMTVVGIPFLSVMGLAAAGTVTVAVLIALTLLPALLGFSGERMLRGRHVDRSRSMGHRWATFVTSRPIPVMIVVIAALLAVGLPALHIRTGLPGDNSDSKNTTQRRAYDLLAKGFGPGFDGPLTIVIDAGGHIKDTGRVFTDVQKSLGTFPDVAAVTKPVTNATKQIAIMTVTPDSSPDAIQTSNLVKLIRARAARARSRYGVDVLVTGTTALNIDTSAKLNSALPIFVVLIVVLALLLLLILFRSLAVPIKAVAGFLLTIVASLGLVVWIFQEGHLANVLGVPARGPILSFLPILMVAILFGLAMDYEVFLVSRMRESYVKTGEAHRATIEGFAASSRVVTAAGLIMISVFSGFVLNDDPTTKSIGFALAFGVLVDAFLVRMTLLPAAFALLGDRAWALPAWLRRALPHTDIEDAELDDVLIEQTGGPHDRATA